LVGCSFKSNEDNTHAYYLTPLQTSSTKVSGVDLVTGAVHVSQSDVASNKQLSFSRIYTSNTKESNQTLGNFTHNFNTHLNPKVDYAKEPLASALFASKKKACDLGWEELAPKVLLGKLEGSQAIYNAEKGLCDIYEDSQIKASLPVKNKQTQALASDALLLLHRADNTELLFFQDKTGRWQNTTKSPVTLTKTAQGYTLTLPNDSIEGYDTSGKLISISHATKTLALSYDESDRLSTLTNSFNQSITLHYDANTSLLQELTSYDDSKIRYSYNEKNQFLPSPTQTTAPKATAMTMQVGLQASKMQAAHPYKPTAATKRAKSHI